MSAVLTSYQIPLLDGEIIQFDKQNPLGRARHGAVFRGFTGGRNVAVKVIPEQVSPMVRLRAWQAARAHKILFPLGLC